MNTRHSLLTMNKNHFVAIMAGGIGSRFWPMSRTAFPKQFLDILHTGRTLIQGTYDRYLEFIPNENIYVVTATEYAHIVKEQLPNLPAENILCEPSRKNTAPCIAYITHKLQLINPDGLLICAPADHLILDAPAFTKVCTEAFDFVNSINALVTLGIKPTYANTGYGYIQHEPLPVADSMYKVKTFTEKPTLEIAKTFLASGDFLWNAGIFVWKVAQIVKAFEMFQPEMFELFDAAKDKFNTPQEKEAIDTIYPLCVNISIDVAIMEKADNVDVVLATFDWSDLGTWKSLNEHLEKDTFNNSIIGGKVYTFNVKNCLVNVPEDKVVLIDGLSDHIIVESDNVLMILKTSHEQELKNYLKAIEEKN